MKIAFDARELSGQATGVGRVVGGLLEAWPEDDEIILYARTPIPWRFLCGRRRSRVVSGIAHMPGALWEQVVLPRLLRRDGVEALFAPAYGMPIAAPCAAVVGMHDCACEATPQEFTWRERRRRQWAARRAAARAAWLLTGSRFAAGEIERWYGVPKQRIVTARYGIGRSFRDIDPARITAVRERYDLHGRTVLFVGAPLARRDLSGLTQTIAGLRATRQDVDLCFVGPQRGTPAGDGPEAPRWLGYVPEEDLAAVYAAATVVAYPTTYEGFGFPVLEALACGTPVVASAAGSLPEVFGEHAWLVPDSRAQWTEALSTLLDDEGERRRRIESASAWAQRRDWGPAARLLRRLLQAAAARGATAEAA
ncbi:MAG: glycosyltransferase family 1 protein [Acidobacteriota bacterium]|jgi:glycosyltransferase involved in cell wall biosynthesis